MRRSRSYRRRRTVIRSTPPDPARSSATRLRIRCRRTGRRSSPSASASSRAVPSPAERGLADLPVDVAETGEVQRYGGGSGEVPFAPLDVGAAVDDGHADALAVVAEGDHRPAGQSLVGDAEVVAVQDPVVDRTGDRQAEVGEDRGDARLPAGDVRQDVV